MDKLDYKRKIKDLVNFFVLELGFSMDIGRDDSIVFIKNNLKIYYRENQKSWRFKDMSMTGSYALMDLCSVDFPLGIYNKKYFREKTEQNYKPDW